MKTANYEKNNYLFNDKNNNHLNKLSKKHKK